VCGIAGIVNLNGGGVSAEILRRMNDRLRHRGPDDEGLLINGCAGLSQRRLSIIDLSSGHQPMTTQDGSIWVTFNGEIYNFQQLRPLLEGHGHRFLTHSDTESILHGYRQWGVDCLRHFRGMFAFALWDEPRKTLLLARDRVGKKPLFYAQAGGQFLFASEMQAMLEHPAVSKEIDLEALDQFLAYEYVPAPKTILKQVRKLPAAHFLTLDLSNGGAAGPVPRIERYWRLEGKQQANLSEDDAAGGLLEVLREAVRLRLISDVPLGALLSGGMDSSVVVALMSQLSGSKVKTFSIGFEEYSELPHARAVAEHYGTEHHEMVVRPSALEVLPKLVRHYGEPFADPSAVPSYYVSKLARRHVTVALNGDGGDESFAGYDQYEKSLLADRYLQVPAVLRKGVIEPLSAVIPDSWPQQNLLRRAKHMLREAGRPRFDRYSRLMGRVTPELRQQLYTPELKQHLNGYRAESWLQRLFDERRDRSADLLGTYMGVDVESYLADDLLVKMDIAAMANSLEARSPLLDHCVMEYCYSLPSHFKIRGRMRKYLLKVIGRKLLPESILKRPKQGFSLPTAAWLRGEVRPLMEDCVLSDRSLARGYFERAPLQRLVKEHLEHRRDNSRELWALTWLELWHRTFVN
jgi:asparagine synthase (glutamine-hydrolysing)